MLSDQLSLSSRILTWLTRKGYPFELQMGQALATNQWGIMHGVIYSDPRTKKSREIDIVATTAIPEASTTHVLLKLSLAVECKGDAGQPWVVLSSTVGSEYDETRWTLAAGEVARQALYLATRDAGARDRQAFDTLAWRGRRGHGIVAVNFDKKSRRSRNQAYAAVRASTSAATALGSLHDEVYVGVPRLLSETVCIVLPVVIFGGRLFELTLDEGGVETLREVAAAKVIAPAPDSRRLVANVLTPSAVPDFLAIARADLDRLAKALQQQGPDVAHTIRERVERRRERAVGGS